MKEDTMSKDAMNKRDPAKESHKLTFIVLMALYIINKTAKTLRDKIHDIYTLRSKLKYTLFESGDEADYSKEELAILKDKCGIDHLLFEVDSISGCEYSTIPAILRAYSGRDYFYNQYDSYQGEPECIEDCISYCESNEYIMDLDDLENLIRIPDDDQESKLSIMQNLTCYSDESEIRELTSDEEVISAFLEYQEIALDEIAHLEKLKEIEEKMHKLLSDAKDEMDYNKEAIRRIYRLKSAVITFSRIKPVAYHKQAYGSELLAYYNIDGFKFHTLVDPYEEINEDLVEDTVIDQISSEIKSDCSMDLNEAIRILLDYLGLNDIAPEEYLKGDYDLADMLDIDFYEREINKDTDNGYDEYDWDEYDTEYDY